MANKTRRRELHDAGPRRESHRARRSTPRTIRVEGMLFCKLLSSPMPHARVTRLDTSAALAMPGVKAILTADDMPGAADRRDARRRRAGDGAGRTRPDQRAALRGRADSRRRGRRRARPRPKRSKRSRSSSSRCPSSSIRSRACGPAARTRGRRATSGCVPRRRQRRRARRVRRTRRGRRRGGAARDDAGRSRRSRRRARRCGARRSWRSPRHRRRHRSPSGSGPTTISRTPPKARCRSASSPTSGRSATSRRAEESRPRARRDVHHAVDRPPAARNAHGDGLLAERQAAISTARRRAPCRRSRRSRAGSAFRPTRSCSSASTPAAASAARFRARSSWRFRRCCRRRPTRR